MNKLLNKPFKAFTIYALLILMCSIPVYYKVVDHIWMEELDEHNLVVKEQVTNRLARVNTTEADLDRALALWSTLQPTTTLKKVPFTAVKKDSFYFVTRPTQLEADRFRGLSSYITLNDQTYLLTVESNIEEAGETVGYIATVTSVFFGLLLIGFIVLNRRIAGRIWKPFSDTITQLNSFDLSKNRGIQFQQTDIEEFQQLNDTLDKLIQSNISAYNQQKIFIENASHELQTPLAVLKSKMDILLQNRDITTEQLQILESIERPISRMSRINKNLLLLAKIENRQFGDTALIDLADTLRESILLVTDYIHDKDLSVDNKITQSFFVSCNKFLLETVVNNLLINSIRHTEKSGTIIFELHDGLFTIKNTGYFSLQHETLFERFNIAGGHTVNGGLGLAIIKEICNRYKWGINYSFAPDFHSFTIRFQ